MDQLRIPYLQCFFILITCLFDIVRRNSVLVTHGTWRVNVGPILASSIRNNDDKPLKYIKSSPSSSFVLSEVTEAQVCNLFSKLNDSKTSIHIPNKLIRIASDNLKKPFMYVYIYIPVYIYYERKKGRNYISQQACFMNHYIYILSLSRLV